ncbi:MAG: alginate export family protein [Planctomycetaceae bacterium]|nr:alginate export family protein [Planctomycetaceae bacterium]
MIPPRRLAAVIVVCTALLIAGRSWAQSPVVELASDPVAALSPPTAESFVTVESAELAIGSPDCLAPAPPCECQCPDCQAKQVANLKAAIAGAYKPLFYDNNFAYINNPDYCDWYPGDHFKQVPIGDCWLLDIGGQYRARYQGERNMRGLGLTGNDDDFLLHRTRIFFNAKYSDWLRVYAEYLDAAEEFNNFAPRAIEVDRSDMLNLFADARLFDGCCGDLWFRIGRQELLYGSERLISPLDWANTRRTFEGFKFLWQGEDWNVDFFATRPVLVDPTLFDSADEEQDFFGGWATYKAIQGQTYDFFAIQYNNDRMANDFEFTTLGGRWLGSQDEFLWEAEGGAQFGQNTNGSDHSAGFVTGGVGRKWSDLAWKPQLMCYYDWANGTDDLGAGNGFNHLFPLAHKYLGFMDLFGRSNIESPNVQLTMQPHQKLKVLVWYYYLFLENRSDTPYNVNMTAFNPGNAPASTELGHEIDLLFTYNINPRMDVVFGYSHFFAGDYYALTPGAPYSGDADFFYTHFQWNF